MVFYSAPFMLFTRSSRSSTTSDSSSGPKRSRFTMTGSATSRLMINKPLPGIPCEILPKQHGEGGIAMAVDSLRRRKTSIVVSAGVLDIFSPREEAGSGPSDFNDTGKPQVHFADSARQSPPVKINVPSSTALRSMPSLLSLSSFILTAPELSPTSSESSAESSASLSPTNSEFAPRVTPFPNDGRKGSFTMAHSNYSQLCFSPKEEGGEWSVQSGHKQ